MSAISLFRPYRSGDAGTYFSFQGMKADTVGALNSMERGRWLPAAPPSPPPGPPCLINMESTFFDEFISVSQTGGTQPCCKMLLKDLRHLRKPQNPIILLSELRGTRRDQSHIQTSHDESAWLYRLSLSTPPHASARQVCVWKWSVHQTEWRKGGPMPGSVPLDGSCAPKLPHD